MKAPSILVLGVSDKPKTILKPPFCFRDLFTKPTAIVVGDKPDIVMVMFIFRGKTNSGKC